MTTSGPVQLKRPEDLEVKPSVTLCLLSKNSESVVGRLIDCVGPYLSEVVAVLNDCTDGTEAELRKAAARHSIGDVSVMRLDASSETAEYYVDDVPATYQVGSSLIGEVLPDFYTGRPILADWAAARNLGFGRCHGDWRLTLDSDDVVRDPESIYGMCHLMAQVGLEAVATQYDYDHAPGGVVRASAYREHLCRNLPKIKWTGRVHEVLTGYDHGRTACVEGNLVVRDLRDSRGAGIRVPGRNLKVLYYQARKQDWQITPREMVYLAAESLDVMPLLAAKLCELYLPLSSWPEEAAWACSMRGSVSERGGLYEDAAGWYERSLALHSGVVTALRLCRVRHQQGRWAEVLEAYELALSNKSTAQLIEGATDLQEDAAAILVCGALRKLGRVAEALVMAQVSCAKFPKCAALAELRANLQKEVDRV